MKFNLPVTPLYDYGTGPAIILLPHSINDFNNWDSLLKNLNPKHRILIPRLPLLSFPPSLERMDEVKNYLLHFIKAHNLNEAILIGNSSTNDLAIQFASDNVDKCGALILNLHNRELIRRPIWHSIPSEQKSTLKTNQHRVNAEINHQSESINTLNLIDNCPAESKFLHIPLLLINQSSSEVDLCYWLWKVKRFTSIKGLITLNDCVSEIEEKRRLHKDQITNFIIGQRGDL